MYIRRGPFYCNQSFSAPMTMGSHHSEKLQQCGRNKRRQLSRHSGCLVTQDDQELRLSVDVPGIKKSNLNVEIRDGSIHITGKRKGYPDIAKVFLFDTKKYDMDKITANLADGVLVLHAPKKATAEARAIPIAEHETETEWEPEKEKEIDLTDDRTEETVADDQSEESESNSKKEEVVVETVTMEEAAAEEQNAEGWEDVAQSQN